MHFYGYLEDALNSSVYPITRFLSESGVQSQASVDTWKEIKSNQSDLNFNSSFIRYRNHGENQTEVMLLVITLFQIEDVLLFYF